MQITKYLLWEIVNEIFLHHDDLPKEVYIGSSIAIDTETTGLNLVRDRL